MVLGTQKLREHDYVRQSCYCDANVFDDVQHKINDTFRRDARKARIGPEQARVWFARARPPRIVAPPCTYQRLDTILSMKPWARE